MRPMKGDPCDDYKLIRKWPMYGSPKIDGLRALKDDVMRSSSYTPFPNVHLQAFFKEWPRGWDGEIVIGNPTDKECFNKTTSVVMSKNNPIDGIRFFVFDNFVDPLKPWIERIASVPAKVRLKQVKLMNADMAFLYEQQCVNMGYEGIVLRQPYAPYKFGRSTLTDQAMLKVKRFEDAEGIVTGVEEMYHNKNEAKKDAQGFTDRSTKKEGMVPAGVMGALVLDYKGQVIRCTSFTDEIRKQFWENPPIGMRAKFRYPPGGKDVSLGGTGIRPPYIFMGLRDWRDV